MINEREIAEKFSPIWKQSFPFLTPNFIRMVNGTQLTEVNRISIPSLQKARYDIVSEIAFTLSEQVITSKQKLKTVLSDNKTLLNTTKEVASKIWKNGNYKEEDLILTKVEINEIEKISNNTLEFISKQNSEKIIFRPTLKGYGFIPNLEADLLIDNTIVEIKTVNRNFKNSDLKQLLIYFALKQMSDKTNWECGQLYNPRSGLAFKFELKELIYKISGGKSQSEAFESLLNGLVREVQIDSKF
ncbi:hypothetical protein [Chryseobacterium sp. OV279]|uniref:hypothetical protein n=1 Tax=Chryseobacterium sp. OV279 TaxID=1500285 RepID=UPI000921D4DD|nr:hypothetical protein [Chryseobacterium sp. OV279]SHE92829.1 hypothetical protein SAMN02787100_1158 [Chryseobacterium sp. OV279]